jgi:hypothetical protein
MKRPVKNVALKMTQSHFDPYAIEDQFSVPSLKHPRLSSLRETMTPVVEKMKKGQSILVQTDKERQRFSDIMNSLNRKYATREIKQNGKKTYRCWAV